MDSTNWRRSGLGGSNHPLSVLSDPQEIACGHVRGGDAHLPVQHHHRGVDVLEEGLQAVALVTEIVLLAPDRLGHVAERRHQEAEVGIVGDGDVDVEVGAGHGPGPDHQSLHGAHDRPLNPEGHHDRGQDDEGNFRERRRDGRHDITPPVTSVTSPAAGATVSGTIAANATATDNVGVTLIEILLDGAVVASGASSPLAWSWNTTTSSNGSHTLTARASDARGNVGSSSISVTVSNPTGAPIGGYRLVQANSTITWYLPAGTTIPSRGYVIIARNATRQQFETFWNRTLGSDVVFINTAGSMPQINGSERYTLYNASGTRIDGATVTMASAGNESLQRKNACGNAGSNSNWNRLSAGSATPGSGAPAVCGKGIYISEFSDALGTGNYIYEFVELYNEN